MGEYDKYDLEDDRPHWVRGLERRIEVLIRKVDTMSDNQAHLDADVAALVSGISDIEAEVASLKAQPKAEDLDFSALDAAVARVQGDAPAPADETPAAPVDDAPVVTQTPPDDDAPVADQAPSDAVTPDVPTETDPTVDPTPVAEPASDAPVEGAPQPVADEPVASPVEDAPATDASADEASAPAEDAPADGTGEAQVPASDPAATDTAVAVDDGVVTPDEAIATNDEIGAANPQ